jgi:hypothetical protein
MGKKNEQTKKRKTPGSGTKEFQSCLSSGVTPPASSPGIGI